MSSLDLSPPESPSTNSLYHATSTMDDITTALANFSRVPSPEPLSAVTCCCGKEDCENLKSWLAIKSRLGSRLTLSAEVGQALLQRHEAYVRQHERKWGSINASHYPQEDNTTTDSQSMNDDLNSELETLTMEKVRLEKLLNQALVNSEVTEVSNKAILQELQDARATITRLTAHHARSIGWDTRLSAAMRERDDMQQERDAETHRARLAESRFAVLKDKSAKLQTEVRRLQESLEEKRLSRLASSENILQDARLRIQSHRDLQLGLSVKSEPEQNELTSVLESLVDDNEILKGDNAELQHLLAESREDLHGLQERLEEQRANFTFPSYPLGTPHTPRTPRLEHHRLPSKDHSESKHRRRVLSQQFDSRMNHAIQEFSILDIPRSSLLSPTDPLTPSQSSHVSYEVDQYPENDVNPSETEKRKGHRPLLLLSRSRGTQTETFPGLSPPSPLPLPSQLPSISPYDPQSESSSSFSDSPTSTISTILERVLALLNRMSQADALTLTNRLKRQNLKGADIGHLSRSTVSHILSEATGLRAQFRSLLEDDKVVLTCTRKDMRLLFKFVKDVFAEMGQMRVSLNDVILDPSTANRVRELSLNPGKADIEAKEREASAQAGVAGWMAPISKLFTPSVRIDTTPVDRQATLVPSTTTRGNGHPSRSTPKLGPALAASATTVNVEFSGTGRSVTSSFSSQPLTQSDGYSDTASGVMNIFAGAPRSHTEFDPWIVVHPPPQRGLRKVRSFRKIENISEDIDEESDIVPPLLGRTLRRRGLSDSSIHSTFSSQADAPLSPLAPTSDLHLHMPSSRLPAWPDRSAVFQALSRTVQNIRATAAETMTPLLGTAEVVGVVETPVTGQKSAILTPSVDLVTKTDHDGAANPRSQPPTPPSRRTATKISQPKPIRVSSSKSGDSVSPGSDPFVVSGSLRDESRMRVSRNGGRDFF